MGENKSNANRLLIIVDISSTVEVGFKREELRRRRENSTPMASSLLQTSSLLIPPTLHRPNKFHSTLSISLPSHRNSSKHANPPSSSSSGFPHLGFHNYCLPLAISFVLSCSNPAQAGFLSGSTGIESVPGPELPSIEFLQRFNEENQKKYAENDERFKSSPIVKELLERSKKNKQKNKQEIQDKYCLRGAEWGVGDCSTEGMTPDERDSFIAMLKEKVAAAATK